MEHIVEFLRSMDEPEMADEVANAHNRLECYSTGITNEIIESLRSVAENSLAELAALKAENESLKLDAERLDWMERKSEESRSGVTFQRVRYAEDGNVQRGSLVVQLISPNALAVGSG